MFWCELKAKLHSQKPALYKEEHCVTETLEQEIPFTGDFLSPRPLNNRLPHTHICTTRFTSPFSKVQSSNSCLVVGVSRVSTASSTWPLSGKSDTLWWLHTVLQLLLPSGVKVEGPEVRLQHLTSFLSHQILYNAEFFYFIYFLLHTQVSYLTQWAEHVRNYS